MTRQPPHKAPSLLRLARPGRGGSLVFVLALLSAAPLSQAQATPSFAEQVGLGCAACHAAGAELTPFGRAFQQQGHRMPPLPVPSGKADPPAPRLEAGPGRIPALPPDPAPDPDDAPHPGAGRQP